VPAHEFLIEDLGSFLLNLEARRYHRSESAGTVVYSKTFSGALIKRYTHAAPAPHDSPVRLSVTYEILQDGKPLRKLVSQLKTLNVLYRRSLPGWKTRREPAPRVREKRWQDLQAFFHRHGELIYCFKYKGNERSTEGNFLFNLQVASTPQQQRLCMEFIKALAEAQVPHGIIRRRREADKPLRQRNGWIRRYARLHRRRGWGALEIAREIQKELMNGTWNERSKIHYNIAGNTICKIAGIKLSRREGARLGR
jgi:hypothetical protein